LKQGLELLDRYGRDDIGLFARTVLVQGEIGFERIGQIISGKL
jgi:hypothetical protein